MALVIAWGLAGCQLLLSERNTPTSDGGTAAEAAPQSGVDASDGALTDGGANTLTGDSSAFDCDAAKCFATNFEQPDAPYGNFGLVAANRVDVGVVGDGGARYLRVRTIDGGGLANGYLEADLGDVTALTCELDVRVTAQPGAGALTLWELAGPGNVGVAFDVRSGGTEALLHNYADNMENTEANAQLSVANWNHVRLTVDGPGGKLSAWVGNQGAMTLSFHGAPSVVSLGVIEEPAVGVVTEFDNVVCRVN